MDPEFHFGSSARLVKGTENRRGQKEHQELKGTAPVDAILIYTLIFGFSELSPNVRKSQITGFMSNLLLYFPRPPFDLPLGLLFSLPFIERVVRNVFFQGVTEVERSGQY